MDSQVLSVIVTAVVSVGTTVVVTLYGPAWKDRVEADRARQRRSQELLERYSEPLAGAAFELQSRLYNIYKKTFVSSNTIPDRYRRLSTLWLFGQFLAWVEIVRRETQVIDYGDVQRTAELQRTLLDVSDILASNTIPDHKFRLFRSEQRALGELMIVERVIDGTTRSDSMGYAEFVHRMETDGDFAEWFSSLDDSMQALQPGEPAERAALIQRQLIDLLDFFDPARIRFPNVNERGKVPSPTSFHDRKRLRPVAEIARFRYTENPHSVIAAWSSKYGLVSHANGSEMRVRLPHRLRPSACELVTTHHGTWVELRISRKGFGQRRGDEDDRRSPQLTRAQKVLINHLLDDFGRPRLLVRSRNPPRA